MLTQTLSSMKRIDLNYYLYLPNDYDKTDKPYPLILFLHGAGERGNTIEDLHRVLIHGIPQYIKNHPDFPFIVVMPQCPTYSYWPIQVENLKVLLDSILNQYRVDRSRIYLTGLSMGGYGTWYMAYQFPDLFAAIAPVCGGGIPSAADRLTHIPIWVFHGAKDTVVPVQESEWMVERIRNAGGNIRFTVYPDIGHDSWVPAYNNNELYEWFLSHQRKMDAST